MDQATASNMENKSVSQRNNSQQSSKSTLDQYNKAEYNKKQNSFTKRNGPQQFQDGRRKDSRSYGGARQAAAKGGRGRDKEGGQVDVSLEQSYEDYDEDYLELSHHTSGYSRDSLPCRSNSRKQGNNGGRKSSAKLDISLSYSRDSYSSRGRNSDTSRGSNRSGGKHKGPNFSQKKCKSHRLWLARCEFLVNPKLEQSLKLSRKLPVGVERTSTPSKVLPTSPPSPSFPLCADDTVEWSAVEEVTLHSTQNIHCPVCLYTPVAPQVTKCGHVYCYPCILHYLALTDAKWRDCPICNERVDQRQLRSARVQVHPDFSVGDQVTFLLMSRGRRSMVPKPVTGSEEEEEPTDCSAIAAPRKTNATLEKVNCIIDKEMTALEVQLLEDPHAPENIFTEQAIALIKEKADTWRQTYREKLAGGEDVLCGGQQRPKSRSDSVCSTDSDTSTINLLSDTVDSMYVSVSTDNNKLDDQSYDVVASEKEILDFSLEKSGTSGANGAMDSSATKKQVYHFYQVKDGFNLYLEPINHSMLMSEYQDVDKLPSKFSATILNKTYDTISEDHRGRLKYLRHLPLSCPFETVEVKLSPPLVSRGTLSHYREGLEKRARVRQEKARKEHCIEKRNLQQEAEIRGQYCQYQRICSAASSIQQAEALLSAPPSNDRETLDQHFPEMGSPTVVEACPPPPPAQSSSSSSFANMVRSHSKPKAEASPAWPSLGSAPRAGGPPRPAWGKASSPGTSPWGSASKAPEEDVQEEFNAPDFRSAFSQGLDALFAAPATGGKKRKKGKRK